MTERLSRPGGVTAARVSVIDLAAAGWRDVRGSFRRQWPLWLGYAVFCGAAQYVSHLILKPGAGFVLTPQFFAYETVNGVGTAVFSGLFLRVFLAPGRPAWRFDRGFLAYVGVLSLTHLATLIVASLGPSSPIDDTAMTGPALVQALAFVVLAPLATWAEIRLILWPIALLLGERAVTLPAAWARMRGAVWPYVAACILLGALPLLVSLVFGTQYFYHGQIAALILGQPFMVFSRLTGVAVAAAVYRARVGTSGVQA